MRPGYALAGQPFAFAQGRLVRPSLPGPYPSGEEL